jgi:hypothetical protein
MQTAQNKKCNSTERKQAVDILSHFSRNVVFANLTLSYSDSDNRRCPPNVCSPPKLIISPENLVADETEGEPLRVSLSLLSNNLVRGGH